ncbi:hypothetical protein TeGR_g3124, partial [Tetraparma gracilis]
MPHPPLPAPAVPTPVPKFRDEEIFDSTAPITTNQYLVEERQTQKLPTSLIHSLRTAIHAPLDVLLRFLVLHFAMALAGRLPQDLMPQDLTPPPGAAPPGAEEEGCHEGRRELLVGRAEFTQAVKFNRSLQKRMFPHDLELREVRHDAHTAVEYRPHPTLRRSDAPPLPHALHGTILLVPGPHGTTTVQMVASVATAAAPAPT